MTADRSQKRIIIVAGPNGAGKTTFANAFLPADADLPRFINADLIAAGIAPFAPETAAIRAGRLMLEEMALCVRRGESFAFETTLSGLGYQRLIEGWRAKGYRVKLFFLSLPDADAAVARVALRVRQGGHDIPEAVIRRRFTAGFHNLHRHTKRAVDSWVLYDNSGPEPVPLDMGESVTQADLAKAKDPDVRGSLAAMRRAAAMARKIAVQTDTGIVIVRDGKPVVISAQELREGRE
jgi:predicted ABC-type ATPase